MRSLTLPRIVYDWTVKHWFLTALALTVSAHWFILLRIAGKDIGATDASGSLTLLGHCVTWPLFIASIAFALLKTRADKYNEEGKTKGGFILQRLLESANDVTSKKASRFVDYILKNSGRNDLQPFDSITLPLKQIEHILDNMQNALSDIFGISRDNIGISIIYQCGSSGKWDWLFAKHTENDLTLEQVLTNPATTARQIIDGKAKSKFFPDKRVGAEQQEYVFGPKDTTFRQIGSVICRDLSIGNPSCHMRAVLSVTTYGKQLCLADDADAIDKILTVILPPFEDRLRLEMALLYIKEYMAKKTPPE